MIPADKCQDSGGHCVEQKRVKKWPHQGSSLQARDNNQVTREPNGCAKKVISQSIKAEI